MIKYKDTVEQMSRVITFMLGKETRLGFLSFYYIQFLDMKFYIPKLAFKRLVFFSDLESKFKRTKR